MTDEVDTGSGEDRWTQVQRIFGLAMDMNGDEREKFLRDACAGDESLFSEVKALLASDEQFGHGPMTNALGDAVEATTRDRRQALVGTMLGAYRLNAVLGFGGAGTVYLAERADRQYSAQVAIKIVESAALHADVSLRFRAERQILASLNHPNIARMIDAGETEQGSPYLVMEYIQGEPIDRYCDRMKLDVDSRVALFLQVCAAVQYAHQNLVVHRDLKPANVLVTNDGTPKLLDFGIAKLLDTRDTAAVLALTRMNDRVLTPEYASPEQILGRPVTTGSDVYALGVVLYELLTGLAPYDVSNASQLELERSICVSDPPKPSVALRKGSERSNATATANLNVIAEARSSSLDRLRRRLDGDLDAIVMRALRKEPEHRYGSIEQLTADLRRYVDREPVEARQGNWVYYSQRFARRHAFGVSVGAAFVAFLTIFAVMTSLQNKRIAAERDRATQARSESESVSSFMLNVFAAADPFTSQGRETTARELLDEASSRISRDLDQQPEVRARLLEAMGRAYRRQAQYDRAATYLRDAVAIQRSRGADHGVRFASTLTELAMAMREQGNFIESEKSFSEALEIIEVAGRKNTTEYAELLAEFGRSENLRGNLNHARTYFEQSLALTKQLKGPRDPSVAAILSDLTTLCMWTGELTKAEALAREALSIYSSTLKELHPDRVQIERILGDVLVREGRFDEAGEQLERALAAQRLLFGKQNPQSAATLESLMYVRQAQNRWNDAEATAREALAATEQTLGTSHFMTGYYHTSLGALLARRHKYDEAEKHYETALEIFEKTLPPDHSYVASAEHHLGELYLATHRTSDAVATLAAATNRWRRTNASGWFAARSESAWGEALLQSGKPDEAERHLVTGYQALVSDRSADQDSTRLARDRLEKFYASRGDTQKLQQLRVAGN